MAINKCNNSGVQSNFWRDKDKEKDKKKIGQTLDKWFDFFLADHLCQLFD